MSLKRIGDDPSVLQRAFDGFKRWGDFRAAFQALALIANLWALDAGMRSIP